MPVQVVAVDVETDGRGRRQRVREVQLQARDLDGQQVVALARGLDHGHAHVAAHLDVDARRGTPSRPPSAWWWSCRSCRSRAPTARPLARTRHANSISDHTGKPELEAREDRVRGGRERGRRHHHVERSRGRAPSMLPWSAAPLASTVTAWAPMSASAASGGQSPRRPRQARAHASPRGGRRRRAGRGVGHGHQPPGPRFATHSA